MTIDEKREYYSSTKSKATYVPITIEDYTLKDEIEYQGVSFFVIEHTFTLEYKHGKDTAQGISYIPSYKNWLIEKGGVYKCTKVEKLKNNRFKLTLNDRLD